MKMHAFALFLLLPAAIFAQEDELLSNPDFEDPLGGEWFCNSGCDLTRDNSDSYTGDYSALVTNRENDWSAISQFLSVEANTTYAFSCYIKLEEPHDDVLFYKARAALQFDYANDEDDYTQYFSWIPFLKHYQGWQKIGGDFFVDNKELIDLRLFVHINTAFVDYRIDSCSVTKLPNNNNWKEEANARITDIRQNDITLYLSLNDEIDPSTVEMDVKLVKHGFPFGSAVRADLIAGTDEDSLKYSQTFYDNFEWSVLENKLKWRQMEWNRDELRYPDEAIDILLSKGIPIRGHTVFWDREDSNPDWLIPLSANEMVEEMYERLDDLFPHYNGKLVHWDINNEQLHDSFYEDKTLNVNITADMFKEVQARDPDVLLFLNDYNIVNLGSYTQAFVNSVEEFGVQCGAPIQALGIQSHLKGEQNIDEITAITFRLATAAQPGLPLWITELDISEVTDPTRLADSYEDILTLYFSDPNIHGVLLWGFSDQHHSKPDAALFEGPDYIPNESGLRFQQLLQERWNTTATFSPSSNEETFGLRGFHGTYAVNVRDTATDEILTTVGFILHPGEDTAVGIQV